MNQTKIRLSLILIITLIMSLFLAASTGAAVTVVSSGKCGDNVTYTVDSIGVVTIAGTGEMTDWASQGTAPFSTSPFAGDDFIRKVVIGSGVTSVGNRAFLGCPNLRTVQIGDDVKDIGLVAFENCTALEHLTIGNSVTNIQDSAFRGCAELTTVIIPDNVVSIGLSAFAHCSQLTSVSVGSGVREIKNSAFVECTELNNVNIKDVAAWCEIDFGYDANPIKFAHKLYLNGSPLKELKIPEGVSNIPDLAFLGCTSLVRVTIPDSVTNIDRLAFANCSELTDAVFGKGLTRIGESAFINCNKLTNVHISDIAGWCGIKFVDNTSNPLYYAEKLYLNNTLLTDLVIPDGVKDIANTAFISCTELKSVTIPDGVTNIGDYAFALCYRVQRVTIPYSMKSIGNGAFSNCVSLSEIHYTGSEKMWETIQIEKNNSALSKSSISDYCKHALEPIAALPQTCTEDGVKMDHFVCKKCGAHFLDESGRTELTASEWFIPGSGHNVETTPGKPATCTEPGFTDRQVCTVCGEVLLEREEIPAAGHKKTDWKIKKEATRTEQGLETIECTVCGEIFDERLIPSHMVMYRGDVDGDNKVTAKDARLILRCSARLETLKTEYEPLGDVNGDEKLSALDARLALRMSARLDDLFKFTETYHVHKYNEKITKGATCTRVGSITKTCEVCGKTIMLDIPMRPHDFREVVKQSTCVVKGSVTKTCRSCGTTVVESLDLAEHNYQVQSVVKPTCTNSGTTTSKCLYCGKTKVVTVPATQHQFIGGGCLSTKKCVVCGYSTGSVTGHNVKNGVCTKCGISILAEQKALGSYMEHYTNALQAAAKCNTLLNTNPEGSIEAAKLCGKELKAAADSISSYKDFASLWYLTDIDYQFIQAAEKTLVNSDLRTKAKGYNQCVSKAMDNRSEIHEYCLTMMTILR